MFRPATDALTAQINTAPAADRSKLTLIPIAHLPLRVKEPKLGKGTQVVAKAMPRGEESAHPCRPCSRMGSSPQSLRRSSDRAPLMGKQARASRPKQGRVLGDRNAR